MHSEHDLKEQSDAQIIVSRFPFRGEGSKGSEVSKGSEGGGGALRAQIKKKGGRLRRRLRSAGAGGLCKKVVFASLKVSWRLAPQLKRPLAGPRTLGKH